MERVDIKDISGSIRFSTIVNEGSKRKFLLMKEDYVTVKFNLDEPIFFKLGDYIDDGHLGVFEICDIQKPAYNAITASYDYELRLDAYYWKWKNKIFKYTPETAGQEASWNLTAPLDVQVGIVLRNLKALGYTYKGQDFVFSIDSTVENKAQLMSYDNINILDACFEMAKKWDCECWVTENIIHFGRCEFGDPVNWEIGVNVEEMTRTDSQSAYATRIYAFGSTRNIPSNYRPVDESVVVNGVVQRRLMLPAGTPYIDAYPNMVTEEAIEQVIVFDDIYPRRTGTMSDIAIHKYTDKIENADGTITEEKWDTYRFKDTGITFSKAYVLAGEELKITFHSGKLNGMMFGVIFNPDGEPEKLSDGSWNPAAQVWEIVRNEDYGRKLPGDVLIPANGDTYVLTGWDSTKITQLGLVSAAEVELKTETEKYVAKSKMDPSTYNCKMMSGDAYGEDGVHNLYSAGQKVKLINKAYFEDGRQSRVIGFEHNLDYPFDSPIFTVGETAAYSRIGELEEKLDSLTLKGQTYNGGGSGVYIIGTNDSTPPSNRNVFSASKSLATHLRKDMPDTAKETVTFSKGLIVGDTTASIDENGNVEVGSVTARTKVKAATLEVTGSASVGTLHSEGNISTGADIWAKGDTHTLNLLVQALAKTYDLNVEHVATLFQTIVKDYISSERFIPGLMGEGMKLYKAINGDWNLEIDNAVVRKAMTIFELIISKVRAVNGGLVISSANGRVKSVSETSGDPAYYVLGIEGDMMFVTDDLVRCQVYTSGHVKYYWVPVASVNDDSILILKSVFPNGTTPAVGDDLVQMGNLTNPNRQGILYLTASEDGKPRISVLDGVNSTSLAGKSKVILGCLDGMTDTDFPADLQPSGYGLYAMNCFLKGIFILRNGKSIEQEFSNIATELSAIPGKIELSVTTELNKRVIGGANLCLKSGVCITGVENHLRINMSKYWRDLRGKKVTLSFDYEYSNLVLGRNSRIGLEEGVLKDGTSNYYYIGAWKYFDSTSLKAGTGRFVHTITVPNDIVNAQNIGIGFYIQVGDGTTMKICNPQIEIGDTATEWKPAPEDGIIESKEYTNSQISVVEGKITSTVEKINTVDGRVTGLASRVEQTEKSITSVVGDIGVINSTTNRHISKRIDLRGWDNNKFFPLVISIPVYHKTRVEISRPLDAGYGKPSYGTHDGGFSMNLTFEMSGSGWGSLPAVTNIFDYTKAWISAGAKIVVDLGQITETSTCRMGIRGGSMYDVTVDDTIDPNVINVYQTDYHGSYNTSFPVRTDGTEPVRTYGYYTEIKQTQESIALTANKVDDQGRRLSAAELTLSSDHAKLSVVEQTANSANSLAGTANNKADIVDGRVTATQNGLVETGINITSRKIILKADNLLFQNNTGQQTVAINANGKLSANVIEAAEVVAQAFSAQRITTGNLTVTDGAKIGAWNISGGSLVSASNSQAKILLNMSGNKFLRINEEGDSPTTSRTALMSIRNDNYSGLSIESYGSSGFALRCLANAGTANSIESYGSHIFAQRGGEKWNAPGMLCTGYVYQAGTVTNEWGNGCTLTSAQKIATGKYRIYHSLKHLQYAVLVQGLGGYGWVFGQVETQNNSYFEVLMLDANKGPRDCPFRVFVVGRNVW
ncbi:hypothetical protein [Bacteroides fragilis]|jgi:hypothetical protein|uniref:Tail protein n=1 Tax=Siphoviridae sp. ct2wG4 TaxID=2826278 RepID=A0A8S5QX80_9CAUD|nr:hypothetical protein [Bacteroides fragilis]EXY41472.1 hypothetical protein M117_1474 [Bacteroides fragilis str. 3774 T13]MCE9080044.1 hypothetical protein [Bacteroides fragilis]MCE9084528.1 hypothetical protein [Bacteroides fragilis]DAE23459.1 MAG TPA: tail protein [Siphoviridae sp. ct2wG4]